MYKKYILLFTFMFGLYSHSHEEFFRNNKIIISIKKIPVNFEKNSDIIHRFPFDEYYISEKFEILKINFSPLKNRENIFNG
ncbi:hypothetical protein, partial [Fusobacterium sp. PH5-44]|uniref:hypothetical protein n=1 Tax=unclassified Fusobacterium TaxID=2648384 RepID=UPI003D1B4D01